MLVRIKEISCFTFLALFMFVTSNAYSAPTASTFNDAFDHIDKYAENEKVDASYKKLWDILDSLVLEKLNSGVPPKEINELLSTLHGFELPRERKETQVGGAVFFGDPGRETASYFIIGFKKEGTRIIVGCYNGGVSSKGRLSVYVNADKVWIKSSEVNTSDPFTLHRLPASRGLYLATMEKFSAADRDVGDFTVWQLNEQGQIIRQRQAKDLVDYDLEEGESTISVTYMRFLENLSAPVMGPRLVYRSEWRVGDKGVEEKETSLTPYLEALEKMFGNLYRNEMQAARKYVQDTRVLKKLQGREAALHDVDFDERHNIAKASVTTKKGSWLLTMKSKRGQWLVVGAKKIRD